MSVQHVDMLPEVQELVSRGAKEALQDALKDRPDMLNSRDAVGILLCIIYMSVVNSLCVYYACSLVGTCYTGRVYAYLLIRFECLFEKA